MGVCILGIECIATVLFEAGVECSKAMKLTVLMECLVQRTQLGYLGDSMILQDVCFRSFTAEWMTLTGLSISLNFGFPTWT